MAMPADSLPYTSSNRHNSTRTACCEYTAKLVPCPSQVAPSGSGRPGHTVSGIRISLAACAPRVSNLRRRKRSEWNGQPVGSVVELVQHLVRGFFELQRRERRLHIFWDEVWPMPSGSHVSIQKAAPRPEIPFVRAVGGG